MENERKDETKENKIVSTMKLEISRVLIAFKEIFSLFQIQ